MSGGRKIVVIGGGPAGTWAAIAAKKHDPAADVRLLTDEACEPYEKPPLSKGVITGKTQPEDALIAGPKGLAGHGIALELQARVSEIDRATMTVRTESGASFSYDSLVLATGSRLRELPMLPMGTPRVHYLRTETQARALRTELAAAQHFVVVGAGLIGLEVAASARELGVKTTVIEVANRILSRVCGETTAARVLDAHRARGVDVRVNCKLTGVAPEESGRIALATDSGTLLADLIVVGIGTVPDDRLATAAGLASDNGIVVDERCATSDPSIFAAGDVVQFPCPHGLVRREDWRHAQDQGAVAGRNAAGGNETYRTLPSYWSEQHDLYIQGVGWPHVPPDQTLHRTLPEGGFMVLELSGDRLVRASGINAQREMAAARRLIERQKPVSQADLADATRSLADLAKAKA